jgi:hypothetical protein
MRLVFDEDDSEVNRRFPVRIRIAVPPEGLGTQLDHMKWWLDENSRRGQLGDGRPRVCAA